MKIKYYNNILSCQNTNNENCWCICVLAMTGSSSQLKKNASNFSAYLKCWLKRKKRKKKNKLTIWQYYFFFTLQRQIENDRHQVSNKTTWCRSQGESLLQNVFHFLMCCMHSFSQYIHTYIWLYQNALTRKPQVNWLYSHWLLSDIFSSVTFAWLCIFTF